MSTQAIDAGAARLLPALAFIAIFVPGHMFGWAVEWAWLGVMVIYCSVSIGLRRWRGESLGISPQLWALLFGILCGISALSLILTLLREQPINERDAAEMLRFPIYGLMVCFFAVRIGRGRFIGLDLVTRLAILYALGCAAVFQFKVPVLYPLLQGVIYAEAKVLFGLGVIRVPFPFENPNFLAYFLVLALAYFCFLRRSISFMMMTLVLLFLTGSRSGWISAAAVLGWFALADMIGPSLFRRTLSLTILGLVVTAAIVFWEQLTSFARVAELVNAVQGGNLGNVNTARIRLDAMSVMLDSVTQSPLLGWGPGRALEFDVADNQYLSWVMAWGALGLATIATIGAIATMHLWATALGRVNKIGVMGLLSGVGLMLATGDFLENYRLFFLTVVYLHVFYETLRDDRELRAAPQPQLMQARLQPSTP